MTTVGYGDKVPVTVEGKIVAMVLMIVGIGLFGVLTGIFARFLVEPELRRDEDQLAALTREIRSLRERIERMEGNRS
jgi:voltage-gated potassium channel